VTWDGLTPPYSTIVADPPWEYENANKAGSAFMKDRGWRSVQQLGYSPMSLDAITALSVADLAADDAHLYLWTTNTFLYAAHDIARAWGFKPKTVLTWTKTHQDDPTRVSMKTGYYFRGATEHVVFAVRGSLRLQTRDGLPTGYLWPRIGKHSRKPAAFYDLVEKASPGPRVELFSRAPALGWDSWGLGYEGAA
jgi:N6-adenosine-specific RNA methylase IME4